MRRVTRRRITGRAAATLLGLCVALGAGAARAQDAASIAQRRFELGVHLFEARSYRDALEELTRSFEAYNSPNTRLYIARCRRELGELAAAWIELQRVQREATDLAQRTPRYRLTAETAQAELESLEPRIARLTVEAPGLVSTGSLTLNGRPLPLAALGTAMVLDPGEVRLRVEVPGRPPQERTVTLVAGREEHLLLGAEAPPPQTPREPLSVAPRDARFYAGVASVGLGGAGLVLFAGLQGGAELRFRQLQGCAQGGCPEAVSTLEQGRAMEAAGNALLALGLAAAGVGVGLLVWSSRAPASRVALLPTPRGLTLGGTF